MTDYWWGLLVGCLLGAAIAYTIAALQEKEKVITVYHTADGNVFLYKFDGDIKFVDVYEPVPEPVPGPLFFQKGDQDG